MIMQIFSRSLQTYILFAAALLIASPTATTFAQDSTVIVDESEADRRDIIKLGSEERVVRIENSEELLVRSVEQSNPTTDIQITKAIGLMLDIERFDKANGYLDSLSKLELDGEASYELNRLAGSDLLYLIARTDELQPLGREVVLKVFRNASEWANSDERIAMLIKELGDESEYARGEAFAKLNRIGDKAVARVLESFADESREDDFPALRGALYAFGDAAIGPLLGAAEASNASVRIEAIRGLAKQESNEAIDMLLRTSLSMRTQSPYRDLAAYQLEKSGRAPDRSQVEDRLAGRVEEFLNGRRLAADSLFGDVDFWAWNDETEKLEVSQANANVAARMRAADLAKTLFEINPASARNRELHLLSQLESLKWQSGPSDPINVDAFLKQADNIHAAEIEKLLVRAIDMDLMNAATASCEVLKQIGDSNLLIGNRQRPLVDAILVGDRHLQFAAFDAIAEINPKSAYAGSSYVGELAAFLASSRFKQKMAIGHNRNEVTQAWASAVGPAGWATTSATSSQEFFEKATKDPDVAMLVVSDTLTRPAHRELVQQLRSHWKTRRMPIGLLARDSDRLIKSVRYTEGIDRLLTFPISLDGPAIALQLEQLEKQESPWSVSSDDRYRHASRAVQWLEESVVDPQLSYYRFAAHQKQLLGLLYHPEFTSAAAKILASQPSAVAQRAMLGFVSQGDLPIEAREMVADAFEAAVKRGGTMLTSNEIELQYERYNASENQPEETQKVLGRILDVIEARRKASRR